MAACHRRCVTMTCQASVVTSSIRSRPKERPTRLLVQLTPSQPRFVAALPLVFYPILSGLSITMFILLLTLLAIIAGSKYQVRIVAVAYAETLTLSHIRSSLVARRSSLIVTISATSMSRLPSQSYR